jgi:hypothetical protein
MDNTYNKDRESVRPDLVSVAGRLKPDPVLLAQQAKYKQQGLTITSNNTSIIPRDSAGNIILQENSETNPLLIIEPVTTKITTNSILRVIDTRFQYYSFPASIIATPSPAIDFDIDLTLDNDPIYGRYKPSIDLEPEQAPESAGINFYSGILMDEVEEGLPQRVTNGYYITKEIKNSGKDLRFRIKLNHQYTAPDGYGTCNFSLIKSGPDYPLNRAWRYPYATNSRNAPDVAGSISPGPDAAQTIYINEIITNDQFEIGDVFGIGISVGNVDKPNGRYHTLIADQSYWIITDASKNVDEWNQEI